VTGLAEAAGGRPHEDEAPVARALDVAEERAGGEEGRGEIGAQRRLVAGCVPPPIAPLSRHARHTTGVSCL
jgi:hypothetical protein